MSTKADVNEKFKRFRDFPLSNWAKCKTEYEKMKKDDCIENMVIEKDPFKPRHDPRGFLKF